MFECEAYVKALVYSMDITHHTEWLNNNIEHCSGATSFQRHQPPVHIGFVPGVEVTVQSDLHKSMEVV